MKDLIGAINIDYMQDIIKEHEAHYWYGGEVVRLEYMGYKFHIEAVGDVYAELYQNEEEIARVKDKNNTGRFYEEMYPYIKDDNHLFDLSIFHREIDENEEMSLYIGNNNWWEVFVTGPDGRWYDLMHVLDSYLITDAVDEVVELIPQLITWVQEVD